VPRIVLLTTAVIAATLACCGPAAAAPATLTGTLAGLPAAAAGTSVRAVQATSGEILADARLGGSRSYRLAVPAGVYLLVGEARSPRGVGYSAIGHAISVGSGAKRRVPLTAAPVPAATSASFVPVARAASLAPGAVVTVNGVVVNAEPGAGIPSLSLDGAVLGQVFDACSAQGVRFVDTDRRVVDAIQAEQDLRDSGRSQDTWQFDPIAPQYRISGEGRATPDGQVTVVLNLIEVATGAIVGHVSATGKTGNLDDVISEAADKFSQDQCDVPIASRCPRLNGARLACVTSMIEIGGGTASQTIRQGSCPDPEGFAQSAATGLRWRYTWPAKAILAITGGGAPGGWTLTGDYRVDAMCGLNNEHCSASLEGSRGGSGSLAGWTETGRPGRWSLKIPALASSYHPSCSTSAIDDPVVTNSAIVTATLRGRAGHPIPRTKIVPFTLTRQLPCGSGCTDSYAISGRVLIRGEW